jgi:hypothetical protein
MLFPPVARARRAVVVVIVTAFVFSGVVSVVSTTAANAAGTATLVQHPARQTTADFPPNTDFAVPWTIPPTPGDTFLLAASNYCATGTTTPAVTSDPGGWTLVTHAFGTNEGGFMWGKLLLWRWTGAGAPGNVVMQMQGGTPSCDMSVAAFEYQGLQPNPVDVNTQTSFNGTPTQWTLPTVTTAQDNELLFVAEANRKTVTSVTSVTPGFTIESNKVSSGGTTDMGLAIADRVAATAGPYTPVINLCSGCGGHPGAIVLGLRIAPVSGTAPAISNVAVSNVTGASATVTWTTDLVSTSAVAYGLNTTYGSSATGASGTSHSVTLGGLASGSTYHFQVSSTTTGGTTSSSDATFTTTTPAPVITTGPTTSGITATTATIAWSTDRASTSQVQYGTDTGYGSATTLDGANVTAHSQTLVGLSASTTYHFVVTSVGAGGTVTSGDATFSTAAPGKTNQTITFGALAGATLAQSPITVAATASSHLAVGFSSLTPAVCTAGGAGGATITLLALGTCTIQADQPGDSTFNPAPPVQQSFGVADTSQIAYPDLIGEIPTNGFGISHPTTTTKEFDYTHIIYNAGAGPLEVQPTNYNSTTNLATAVQQLYSYNGSTPVLAQQLTARDQFFYHVAHGHYHFPLATFGLFGVNPDGSMGGAVAVSPKNGFCLGDDVRLDASLPHSPAVKGYNGSTCTNPNAVRGISSGWGDRYDKADPGQAIDITGVPDGVYWFHSVVDPDGNFVESDKTNNVTDIKLRISGDTVTPVSPLMSQGSFVFDQSIVADAVGPVATPAFSTSAPNELLVAFVSGFSQVTTLTSTVTGGGLTWTLAKRANGQPGGVDVWTAMATNPLSNAVVTATTNWPARDTSMTVFAIKGAAGIGATAGRSSATGVPSISLTTTKPGSWVMTNGNDPSTYSPHQIGAGKTMFHQYLDSAQRQGAWMEATSSPVPAAGTLVSFPDTTPPNDPSNEVAVEILPAASVDGTPPVISAVAADGPGPTSASVTWATDEPATSKVEYGVAPALDQSTGVDPTLVTQHGQPINGLAPNTTYSYRVVSTDAAGNTATGPTSTFTTAPPRTTPPLFTNVHVIDVQADQATISWTTDEPADTRVDYGITPGYGTASALDPTMVATHFALITNLAPTTVYHYRVDSTDAFSNAGSSADFSFQTLAVAPPIVVEQSVFRDGTGNVTTAAFNTASSGDLLVAFVGADGNAGVPQTATVTGAGLTWTRDQRANTQNGTAEVWHAIAPGALTNATVTSSLAVSASQSITVVAFSGARGIGATAAASAASGAPSAEVSMTGSNSLVYAVGNDWDHATARTPALGQSIVHQFVDTTGGDTFWTQALNGTGGPVESDITMADTAPTADRWNLVAVEIQRPIGVTPPAPTAPAVSAVNASDLTTTSATISWTTDQISTSQVQYGTAQPYDNSTTLNAAPVTAHSQSLTGLAPGTLYHYAVASTNGVGTTTSTDFTFTTAQVPKTPQTITFGALADVAIADSPVTVGATASSGLAVSFSSTTPAVCSVASTTVTLLTGGTCSVRADQPGDATFAAAPPVTQSFIVIPAKVDQTISFPAPADVSILPSPVTVGATASSGLAVSFSSTTPAVCSVTGAAVTLLAVGGCTLQADQGGNTTYNPAPPVQQSFSVTKAAQAITFPALPDVTVSQASVGLSATASSGFVVTFSSNTPLVCTVSGTSATLVSAGTCTIQADQAGDPTYDPAPAVARSFTVAAAKLDQTIAFGSLGDATLAQTPLTIAATASSGLAVTFSSLTPAVCVVAGTTVGLLTTGTCTVRADQAGNATYNAAPAVQQSFNVTKAAQTITFGALADRTLLQTPLNVTAVASSGLAVAFASTTPAVCAVTGAAVTLLTAGTCTIRATQAGNTVYNAAAAVQQSFNVTKAAQTITFTALANRTLAQTPFTVTATASSGLAVAFTSTTPAVCTVAGASVTLVTVGTCTIQAAQAGNTIYNAAPFVPQSFTVSPSTGISIDKTVFKDGKGAQTTAAFSTTAAGDVLVAFVGADGPTAGQSATVTGAGLTWTLVRRTAARPGTAEIWRAIAPAVLTNVTVTSTLSQPTAYDQSLTVVAFKGASGVGAVGTSSAATGAPTVSLTTTKARSWVFGVGNDWDRAVARTVGAGQVMVHQFVDAGVGDTYWTQSTVAPTPNLGTVVAMSDTAPTNDRWNFSSVEVLAS